MNDVWRFPRPVAANWDWQVHGACRGADAELFFHPDGVRGRSRAAREEAAKAVCASCPVLEPCREHVLAAREPYGTWGGLSEAERPGTAAHAARSGSGNRTGPAR